MSRAQSRDGGAAPLAGKTRVAFIGTKGLPARGGTERVLEAIVAHLDERFAATVYCDARHGPRRDVAGVRLIRIDTPAGKHARPAYLYAACALDAVLRRDFDVVHLQSVEAGFVIPLLRLRYPVLATAHGSATRSPRAKWSPAARRTMGLMEYPFVWASNVATSVSAIDAEYLSKRYRRRVVFVPNGVDVVPVDPPGPALPTSPSGLAPGEYLLFAAGRIDETKGCHLFVEAVRRLACDVPALVVGDPSHAPAYVERLRRDAPATVHFAPLIEDRGELFSLIAGCRVFTFASLTEGMSMMLLEAAALGAPVVCSDIDENRAVLGDTALYFRSGDAGDLARKLEYGLDHPEEMATRGSAAQAHVRARYSWPAIVRRYETFYDDLAR